MLEIVKMDSKNVNKKLDFQKDGLGHIWALYPADNTIREVNDKEINTHFV
jgi:hypothetical protein